VTCQAATGGSTGSAADWGRHCTRSMRSTTGFDVIEPRRGEERGRLGNHTLFGDGSLTRVLSGAAPEAASVNQAAPAGPCRLEVTGHEAERARTRTRSTRPARPAHPARPPRPAHPAACDFRSTRPAAAIGFPDAEPEAVYEHRRVSKPSKKVCGSLTFLSPLPSSARSRPPADVVEPCDAAASARGRPLSPPDCTPRPPTRVPAACSMGCWDRPRRVAR